MSFEEYLQDKKIDAELFKKHEPELWAQWKHEFEQMNPKSFTMQKLNLINPVRRKYTAKTLPAAVEASKVAVAKEATTETGTPSPKPAKPVFKPKPKMGG